MKPGFLNNGLKIILSAIIFSAICPRPAYAYLDPGTGSMVLQMILAAFVGVGCTFKIWKQKLFNLFKRNKNGR